MNTDRCVAHKLKCTNPTCKSIHGGICHGSWMCHVSLKLPFSPWEKHICDYCTGSAAEYIKWSARLRPGGTGRQRLEFSSSSYRQCCHWSSGCSSRPTGSSVRQWQQSANNRYLDVHAKCADQIDFAGRANVFTVALLREYADLNQ